MPLNTHHRCAVCNYCCLHGNCGIELEEIHETNKVSFSHKVPCFACIIRIQVVGQLIKLDRMLQGTQFISLGQHKVCKLIQSYYKSIKLIHPVPPCNASDMSSNNDDDKSNNEEANKEVKANNNVTNNTNKQTKRNNRQNRRIHQKHHHSRQKLFWKQINIDHDESNKDTVDTGNSKATPHAMTSKNATTIISKKYIDVQIKLECIKTTKPIDAIDACINRCKAWLSKIQEIKTSFKLHPVDPVE
jgi:hypothetical protein